MRTTKRPKKKLSVSISHDNISKMDKIIKENRSETRSSIIDYSLDVSLEEVSSLLKNPIELEKKILRLKLEDLEKEEGEEEE